jgi:hypothetical protein
MSLKSRSINWLPHQRPAPSCEDFHYLQPADGRRCCRKIVVNGLPVPRSKQPGRIATAIGHFASFHADDSVRRSPLFILTNRRDEVSIFRSLRDRLQSKIARMPAVTAVFEEPKTPDLVLQTDQISVDESVSRIVELMKWRGYRQGGAGRVHWVYLIGATIDRA